MKRYLKTTSLVALPTFCLGMAVAMWSFHHAPTAEADGSAGIAGVWIGTNNQGQHFVQTISSDAEGHRTTFNGGSVNVDYGPGVREAMAGTQGESVRIATDTYAFRAVDYGVVVSEDAPDQIVTISIFEGVTVFDPENGTASATATVHLFGADSDGDNDGLPDATAEPFLSFPADFTLKRLGV